MKLSKQAITVYMTMLQKCIAEQTDIVELMEYLEFEMEDGELYVSNPPESFTMSEE